MAGVTHANSRWRHLPVEIVLLIVNFIPIDHILPFRAISRSIRTQIDTHVLYSYLHRIRLEGLVASPNASTFSSLERQDAIYLSSITASFSHLEDGLLQHDSNVNDSRQRKAIWNGTHAVFRLDAHWLTIHNRVRHRLPQAFQSPTELLSHLGQIHPSHLVEPMKWCITLDHAAQELDLGGQRPGTWIPRFMPDFDLWTVRVEWRRMLWMFLRKEAEIARRIRQRSVPIERRFEQRQRAGKDQSGHAGFLFSHEESCARAVRRECQRRSLDLQDSYEQKVVHELQGLDSLIPLRGQPQSHGPLSFEQTFLRAIEDAAMEVIMRLRRAGPQ